MLKGKVIAPILYVRVSPKITAKTRGEPYYMGNPINIKRVEKKWGYTGNGWVQMIWVSITDEVVIPPPEDPPVSGAGWFTIKGNEKPIGYKPEEMNEGSFDIVWLMKEPKLYKPDFIKLKRKHMDYIAHFNNNNVEAEKWLTAQEDQKKVLSVDEAGNYRIPVPCCSGNNLVEVVEWIGNDFARIKTVNINGSLPDTLPPSLLHTWYGFKDQTYYIPKGEIGGVKFPLLWLDDTALVQRKGLKQAT